MFEVGSEEFKRRVAAYRDAGEVFGSDLAKALLLAVRRSGDSRHSKIELSVILLQELLAGVQRLRELGIPALLVQIYERAARQACREELLHGLETPMPSREAA
jgi:hypothetical protein